MLNSEFGDYTLNSNKYVYSTEAGSFGKKVLHVNLTLKGANELTYNSYVNTIKSAQQQTGKQMPYAAALAVGNLSTQAYRDTFTPTRVASMAYDSMRVYRDQALDMHLNERKRLNHSQWFKDLSRFRHDIQVDASCMLDNWFTGRVGCTLYYVDAYWLSGDGKSSIRSRWESNTLFALYMYAARQRKDKSTIVWDGVYDSFVYYPPGAFKQRYSKTRYLSAERVVRHDGVQGQKELMQLMTGPNMSLTAFAVGCSKARIPGTNEYALACVDTGEGYDIHGCPNCIGIDANLEKANNALWDHENVTRPSANGQHSWVVASAIGCGIAMVIAQPEGCIPLGGAVGNSGRLTVGNWSVNRRLRSKQRQYERDAHQCHIEHAKCTATGCAPVRREELTGVQTTA